MTPEEFDDEFDQFVVSAFRLETLQRYSVSAEDTHMRAFREGTPRPERSVRTSPWLRRIALTTAAGKSWSRVHVTQEPLSEYPTGSCSGSGNHRTHRTTGCGSVPSRARML